MRQGGAAGHDVRSVACGSVACIRVCGCVLRVLYVVCALLRACAVCCVLCAVCCVLVYVHVSHLSCHLCRIVRRRLYIVEYGDE